MQYKVHPKWEYVSLSLTVAVSNKEKLSSSHGKLTFQLNNQCAEGKFKVRMLYLTAKRKTKCHVADA